MATSFIIICIIVGIGLFVGLIFFIKFLFHNDEVDRRRNEYVDKQIEKESHKNSGIEKCKNCGYQIFPEETHCSNCGSLKSFYKKENIAICKNCKQPIESDASFCKYCGTPKDSNE
ncbi:MAG: zinc ribbon domain-containing protein [Clostridiales bacterium]|nr:zinc ribbon domain-containing protein [Clostridiales bacterium]